MIYLFRPILISIEKRHADMYHRNMFDKATADRLIEAIMVLFPSPVDGERIDYGFALKAVPDTVEALKQSDSPFAGYVISGVCPPEESEVHYEDWATRSLSRTYDPDGKTFTMEEVSAHLEERLKAREKAIQKVKKALSKEEIQMLGIFCAR